MAGRLEIREEMAAAADEQCAFEKSYMLYNEGRRNSSHDTVDEALEAAEELLGHAETTFHTIKDEYMEAKGEVRELRAGLSELKRKWADLSAAYRRP